MRNLAFGWNAELHVGAYALRSPISLQINAGEWVAVVGHNGIGKSTLFHGLAGTSVYAEGAMHVDGHLIPLRDPTWRFLAGLQFVEQAPSLPGRSHTELDACWIAFARRPGLVNERAVELLLADLRENKWIESDGTMTPRFFDLLVAILSVPSVLLLDEIVLDDTIVGRELDLYKLVKRLAGNAAVLFTDHNIRRAVEISNKLLWLRDEQSARVIDTQDAEAVAEVIATLERDRTVESSGAIQNEDTWLHLLPNQERPLDQLELAIAGNRWACKRAQVLLKDLCADFPFLRDVEMVGQLSGGQRVLLLGLFAAFSGIGNFPTGLEKALDTTRLGQLGTWRARITARN